jgi:hypothetical protein
VVYLDLRFLIQPKNRPIQYAVPIIPMIKSTIIIEFKASLGVIALKIAPRKIKKKWASEANLK